MSMFMDGVSLGDHDVVRFGRLRLWAERGLIHVEDGNDGSYDVMSVRTALQRMNAISDMLGNSTYREKHSPDPFDMMERERHMRMLEGMTIIVQKAKAQGMPSDPTARRWLKDALPKSVVVPKLYGGGM